MKDVFEKPRLMLALDRAEKVECLLEAHVLKLRQNWEGLSEAEQEALEDKREDVESWLRDAIEKAEELCEQLRGLLEELDSEEDVD